jgi:outer membrane protein assembly factor BamB
MTIRTAVLRVLPATMVAYSVMVSNSLISAQGPGPGADWPQWRGPNRDGVASSFLPPREWPAQLTKRWSVEVGTGYSTPIVAGGRVFMFARRGENEVISAHDADTGRELWQLGYGAPFEMHSAAVPHGKGPKSTPAYENGILLTIGMTGIVTAVDAATGRQLWQKPGSAPPPLYTSHAFSPIVDGGTVLFHVGGHDRGALTSFDLKTGGVRWTWEGDGPGYGSPMIARLGGTRQVVTITQQKVVGLNAQTGALLWERPFKSQLDTTSFTPVIHGDLVIVSGNGGPTMALRPALAGAQWTAATVWENPDVPARMTNIVAFGDALFGLTTRNAGQYFAVDARSGKTLWTSPGRQATNAATARAGAFLLSLENDGELVVARSSQTAFEEVKKYKVAETETWAQAAFSGNRIFVKDASHLTMWTTN